MESKTIRLHRNLISDRHEHDNKIFIDFHASIILNKFILILFIENKSKYC